MMSKNQFHGRKLFEMLTIDQLVPDDHLVRKIARRKDTIERVFADAKEKHGMRLATLRGLNKLSMKAMLTFAAMNLKKLATLTWQVA